MLYGHVVFIWYIKFCYNSCNVYISPLSPLVNHLHARAPPLTAPFWSVLNVHRYITAHMFSIWVNRKKKHYFAYNEKTGLGEHSIDYQIQILSQDTSRNWDARTKPCSWQGKRFIVTFYCQSKYKIMCVCACVKLCLRTHTIGVLVVNLHTERKFTTSQGNFWVAGFHSE